MVVSGPAFTPVVVAVMDSGYTSFGSWAITSLVTLKVTGTGVGATIAGKETCWLTSLPDITTPAGWVPGPEKA